jgi:hypothetical protein
LSAAEVENLVEIRRALLAELEDVGAAAAMRP